MKAMRLFTNAKKSVRCLSVAATIFIGVGCTDLKYTEHIDASLRTARIPASTIAVLPIDGLSYQPPSSCFGSSYSIEDEVKYQAHWNERIRKTLQAKFPDQKWVFLAKDSGALGAGGADFPAIKELSGKSAKAVTINAMNKDEIIYEPLAANPELQPHLKKLRETTGADYAVVFVTPSLSGDIQTTYSGSGTWSSQTYYTADIQILVWECGSGKLLYSSGGWSRNTSACFFLSAEDAAIDGADGDLRNNLHKIISYLIEYDVSRHGVQARR
jgi:hypothetical protein